jgi:hypothetical protein
MAESLSTASFEVGFAFYEEKKYEEASDEFNKITAKTDESRFYRGLALLEL